MPPSTKENTADWNQWRGEMTARVRTIDGKIDQIIDRLDKSDERTDEKIAKAHRRIDDVEKVQGEHGHKLAWWSGAFALAGLILGILGSAVVQAMTR